MKAIIKIPTHVRSRDGKVKPSMQKYILKGHQVCQQETVIAEDRLLKAFPTDSLPDRIMEQQDVQQVPLEVIPGLTQNHLPGRVRLQTGDHHLKQLVQDLLQVQSQVRRLNLQERPNSNRQAKAPRHAEQLKKQKKKLL